MISEKQYPSASRFLIADDVREEINKKVSIVGAFTGDEIQVLGVKLGKLEPGHAFPLALLAVFKGGEGTFDIQFAIITPSNKETKFDQTLKLEMKSGSPANVILKFPLFPLSEFGEYQFVLSFDGGK